MNARTKVAISELRPGYILEEDILNSLGLVLIARGSTLDEFLIRSIRNMELKEVYVNSESLRAPEEPMAPKIDIPTVDEMAKNLNAADRAELEIYMQAQTLRQTRPPVPKLTDPIVEMTIAAGKVDDRAKLELSQMVKERVAETITHIYGNPEAEDFAECVRSVADDLMNAIEENDAIAIDIEMLKVSDEYTFKHCVDVASLSMIIGRKYGLSDDEVHEVGIAGLLHDIGKSKIPKEILNKPARLTDEEFVIMKRHSYYSFEIIRNNQQFNERIRLAVLEHHEKMNGVGYPLQLTKTKISLYARILAVADIYDALVTDRPYKKAYPKRDAIEIIMAMTNELDINVMQAFLKSVILYPVGSDVYLSNGEWARVVENNPAFPIRPKCVGIESGKVYDLFGDMACANIIVQD